MATAIDGILQVDDLGGGGGPAVHVIVDSGSVDLSSFPDNVTVVGSITANGQSVTITLQGGAAALGIQITGTWVGILTLEATVNGTDWSNIGPGGGSLSSNVFIVFPISGYEKVRLRSTAWTSGTANITLISSTGTTFPQSITVSGTVNVGTVANSVSILVAEGDDITLGSTVDAAVGDANGTVNSHLRGIAALLNTLDADVKANIILKAGSALIGKVGIDQVTLGANVVNATGSVVTVGNVDLDIRNLVFATDKVDVSGSTVGITGTVSASSLATMRSASGTLAVNGDIVTLNVTGLSTVSIIWVSQSGGFDGIAEMAVSTDGVQFQSALVLNSYNNFGAVFYFVPTAATDPWIVDVTGFTTFRLRLANRTVGSAVISATGSSSPATANHPVASIVGPSGIAAVVTGSGYLSTVNNNGSGVNAVNIQDGGNSITVDGSVGVTGSVAITAASLPLPTGASTEATLALIKAKTDNIDVALSTRTKPADQQHVIVDSSALPTGAALEAGNLATILTRLTAILAQLDVALSTRASQATLAAGLDVALSTRLKAADTLAAVTTVGSITAPVTVQATNLDIHDLTFANDKVDVSGSSVSISGAVVAAVTNDGTFATPAKQDTGNTSLASIKTNTDKIPSQGAAVTAASMPVNIASDQIVPVSISSSALVTANAALENGGNLDRISDFAQLRTLIALRQLQFTPVSNGFVPMEVPAFLIG